ncbi:MAG: hypothetical protein F6K41_36140, partial [Symploca sp. SIO3E6]|nr:hypothetical protein [Caldora sp. SIO3E6]
TPPQAGRTLTYILAKVKRVLTHSLGYLFRQFYLETNRTSFVSSSPRHRVTASPHLPISPSPQTPHPLFHSPLIRS